MDIRKQGSTPYAEPGIIATATLSSRHNTTVNSVCNCYPCSRQKVQDSGFGDCQWHRE